MTKPENTGKVKEMKTVKNSKTERAACLNEEP
jgi:hypothetical protein